MESDLTALLVLVALMYIPLTWWLRYTRRHH